MANQKNQTKSRAQFLVHTGETRWQRGDAPVGQLRRGTTPYDAVNSSSSVVSCELCTERGSAPRCTGTVQARLHQSHGGPKPITTERTNDKLLTPNTPPLSARSSDAADNTAECEAINRHADQRRELVNVACDLPSPGLKVVDYLPNTLQRLSAYTERACASRASAMRPMSSCAHWNRNERSSRLGGGVQRHRQAQRRTRLMISSG